MSFLIVESFIVSLARLSGDEQKTAKTTAFDLQMNPASPGLSFHRLDKTRDKNFWSVRVNADVRIIIHRTAGSLLLCYVDHHDRAYDWAERRRLETHPRTGAAQLVEIPEAVKELVVPVYSQVPAATPHKPRLFDGLNDDELLGLGVPSEWVGDVREADEDSILTLAAHLPPRLPRRSSKSRSAEHAAVRAATRDPVADLRAGARRTRIAQPHDTLWRVRGPGRAGSRPAPVSHMPLP